jgi:hypothetical protein
MILLCVSVFAVLIAFGYSIQWYIQSNAMLSAVESGIARINEKQPYITYDALEKSGFPSNINISIVNPRFKGRVDEFIKQFAKADAPAMQSWNEDSSVQGNITMGVNLFANRYTLIINGNSQSNSTIGGTNYRSASQQNGPVMCNVQLANQMGIFDTFWDFSALSQYDGKALLKDLRLLDCNGSGYTVRDTATQDILMNDGPMRFFISSEEGTGENTRKLRTYVKLTDSEVTPKGDGLINAYMGALFPGSSATPSPSAYGKRNVEVDFSYDGTTNFEQNLKATPIAAHLNNFSLSNQLYQSKGSAHYTNGADPKGRATKLNFSFESSYGPQYDAMLHETVRGFILQLYSPFVPQPAHVQPIIRKYRADELYKIVQPAIPSMHSMGKLTQALDFTYNGNDTITDGDIVFNNLNFSAAPYGLSGRGSIKLTETQPVPASNILLTCSNCPRMIDDITDYSLRLERVFNMLAEQPAPVSLISPQQTNGLKNFLTALAATPADAADKDSFNYTIVSDGASSITINGKRMDEVLVMYNQAISQEAPPVLAPLAP